MGNITSLTSRYLVRKSKRFNIENRAQRFIEQDKLPVAPKHPSTSKILESITNDPKVREQLMRKNEVLEENLKSVYVKSLHKAYTIEDEKDKLRNTNLPQNRVTVPDLKYGHVAPLTVPVGKFSLAQVVDMLSAHLNDPMANTAQVLAEKYSLDVKLVESLIFYFRMFKVEMSEDMDKQKLLTQSKASSFAARMEEFMETQTVYRIATSGTEDYDNLLDDLRKEREKETGVKEPVVERKAKPSSKLEEITRRFTQRDAQRDAQKQDLGIDMDSVYKDVANREKRNEKMVDAQKQDLGIDMDSVYKDVANREKRNEKMVDAQKQDLGIDMDSVYKDVANREKRNEKMVDAQKQDLGIDMDSVYKDVANREKRNKKNENT